VHVGHLVHCTALMELVTTGCRRIVDKSELDTHHIETLMINGWSTRVTSIF
jgi:hypothetical protein